jgi:hypothetical protein
MRWTLLLLLFVSSAEASDIVICKTSINDNLQISNYIKSVDTSQFLSNPLVIINPNVSNISDVSSKYWKCSGGSVLKMTQAEIDALNAQEQTDVTLGNRQTAKANLDERHLKAFVKILIDEINILRANDGLSNRTINQLNTAINNYIDTGAVD